MRALRLHGQSGFSVADVRDHLSRIEHAYNSLYTFDALVSAAQRTPPPFAVPPQMWPLYPFTQGRARFLVSWPPTPESVAPVVPPRHRLVLAAVQLNSPGFWEFIGALNPLEVIRKYLNDRHERRKDREYRESAEERRLELENRVLENQVLREKIEIARSLGATEEDLVPLLNEFVHQPLRRLDRLQDQGAIETAEVVEFEHRRKR